jgi:tetratricopeptide (TPR) repeat protein
MIRRRVISLLLIGLLAAVSLAAAQSLPQRPRAHPVPQVQTGMDAYYERQLAQIDQLIRLGYFSRAFALLEEQERAGAPEDKLRSRRIRIALGVGDHERAVELCRQALAEQPRDAGVLRQLATALAELGRTEEAREALRRYLRLMDEPKGSFATAVDILRMAGDHEGAVALVDSARVELGVPSFLASARAVSLLRLDRPEEAAREAAVDLGASPFNLQLLRKDLLGDEAPPLPEAFGDALLQQADEPAAPVEVALLAANIELTRGRADRALGLVVPRLGDAAAARAALHNAGSLVRELPLVAGEAERAAMTRYLLGVLPDVARVPGLPERLRQRALDELAQTCVFALDQGLLADDPVQAAARFAGVLELVRRGHPESEHLYTAQIQLARFTRDQLREPAAAAQRLETLLLDLDLPLEGVALARLALGECYLAARDTVRARQVLTALGRDRDFRAPAGHAHFLLAKLDLAEGHFATARDRFAAVALDNPVAPYANDALELGLVVAEELQNPTGGPDMLQRYARAVWYEITAEPDSQRVALQRYLERAALQVDLAEKQPLLERARFELAELERRAGRTGAALAQLDRIVADQPDGRLAPRALALRGAIYAEDRADAVAARREYERLLVQYPDYLFATEIRQRLRELP